LFRSLDRPSYHLRGKAQHPLLRYRDRACFSAGVAFGLALVSRYPESQGKINRFFWAT
jgi:hypothetical protein